MRAAMPPFPHILPLKEREAGESTHHPWAGELKYPEDVLDAFEAELREISALKKDLRTQAHATARLMALADLQRGLRERLFSIAVEGMSWGHLVVALLRALEQPASPAAGGGAGAAAPPPSPAVREALLALLEHHLPHDFAWPWQGQGDLCAFLEGWCVQVPKSDRDCPISPSVLAAQCTPSEAALLRALQGHSGGGAAQPQAHEGGSLEGGDVSLAEQLQGLLDPKMHLHERLRQLSSCLTALSPPQQQQQQQAQPPPSPDGLTSPRTFLLGLLKSFGLATNAFHEHQGGILSHLCELRRGLAWHPDSFPPSRNDVAPRYALSRKYSHAVLFESLGGGNLEEINQAMERTLRKNWPQLTGPALTRALCFSEPAVRNIMRQVCLALQHCHKHNVLHRDIKDSNVVFVHLNPHHVECVHVPLTPTSPPPPPSPHTQTSQHTHTHTLHIQIVRGLPCPTATPPGTGTQACGLGQWKAGTPQRAGCRARGCCGSAAWGRCRARGSGGSAA